MNSTQTTSDDVATTLVRINSPDSEELASQIISLLSISMLSMIMGSKTGDSRFGDLSVSRILIMALYIWSWAFTIIATILVSTNNRTCFRYWRKKKELYRWRFCPLFPFPSSSPKKHFKSDQLTATNAALTSLDNYISCILTSYTCDVFYAGTKMIIYQW
jgi:hypothetical protein